MIRFVVFRWALILRLDFDKVYLLLQFLDQKSQFLGVVETLLSFEHIFQQLTSNELAAEVQWVHLKLLKERHCDDLDNLPNNLRKYHQVGLPHPYFCNAVQVHLSILMDQPKLNW
jgi:hypothetical protein